MSEGTITEGQILTGVMFNESMRVVTTRQGGTGTVIAGLVGQNSGQFREVTLSQDDIARLNTIDPNTSYDGDGGLLKLALDAYTLGIAHEFDPYFGLSISRVDPLSHQLEAVTGRLTCPSLVDPTFLATVIEEIDSHSRAGRNQVPGGTRAVPRHRGARKHRIHLFEQPVLPSLGHHGS